MPVNNVSGGGSVNTLPWSTEQVKTQGLQPFKEGGLKQWAVAGVLNSNQQPSSVAKPAATVGQAQKAPFSLLDARAMNQKELSDLTEKIRQGTSKENAAVDAASNVKAVLRKQLSSLGAVLRNNEQHKIAEALRENYENKQQVLPCLLELATFYLGASHNTSNDSKYNRETLAVCLAPVLFRTPDDELNTRVAGDAKVVAYKQAHKGFKGLIRSAVEEKSARIMQLKVLERAVSVAIGQRDWKLGQALFEFLGATEKAIQAQQPQRKGYLQQLTFDQRYYAGVSGILCKRFVI